MLNRRIAAGQEGTRETDEHRHEPEHCHELDVRRTGPSADVRAPGRGAGAATWTPGRRRPSAVPPSRARRRQGPAGTGPRLTATTTVDRRNRHEHDAGRPCAHTDVRAPGRGAVTAASTPDRERPSP